MDVIIAAIVALLPAVVGLGLRLWHTDQTFEGITPGLLPAPGQPVIRRSVRGRKPPVAVRFEPPAGASPGLAGLVIDGRVDPIELSATLIDLGGRGWLTLHPLTTGGKPHDWEVRLTDPPPAGTLDPAESSLYSGLFSSGPVTTLSALRQQSSELSSAAQALRDDADARGWLRALPTNLDKSGIGVLLVVAFITFFWAGLPIIGIGAVIGAILWGLSTRKMPHPLSAEGYAIRIQSLGFKQYLATAEAEQIKFEVGLNQFSRYLPYAMVFGVVDHWRSVFANALSDGFGDQVDGLDWLVLDASLNNLLLLDLLTIDTGIFDSLTGEFADFADIPGIDGIADSLSGLADGFDGFDVFDGFGD